MLTCARCGYQGRSTAFKPLRDGDVCRFCRRKVMENRRKQHQEWLSKLSPFERARLEELERRQAEYERKYGDLD
jgi:recombinational DNA repair protein (RecF pathway)